MIPASIPWFLNFLLHLGTCTQLLGLSKELCMDQGFALGRKTMSNYQVKQCMGRDKSRASLFRVPFTLVLHIVTYLLRYTHRNRNRAY